ncbi:MAG: hypothetical protein K6F46_07045 [Desulfovibrio sp.]|nr:hypothetical protein [Desulfovibrio sp.]
MQKNTEAIKEGIIQLLARATPENRKVVIDLIPAAKAALDSGYVPHVRKVPLHSWRCLLTLLANITAMQTDADVFLRMSNELIAIADRLVPPAEALRQSAEILIHTFHADLYVCRMRDKKGNWHVTSSSSIDGSAIPMVTPNIEESLLRHPVMRAVNSRHNLYIVSNDLHGIERGGESFDCTNYRAGYRSRLCFVLREHYDEKPFGLVMLYTRNEYGFEQFDEKYLVRCSRLINLAVGRRVALARDTLEKAAGAMAHYGNNALNTMRIQAEYCGELVESIDENRTKAMRLCSQLIYALENEPSTARLAEEIQDTLEMTDLTELAGHLGGVLNGTKRMTRIIKSLQKSADRPRLLKYVRGIDVLKLEDDPADDEQGSER